MKTPNRVKNASFNKQPEADPRAMYDQAHGNVSTVASARKTGRRPYSPTPNPDQIQEQPREVKQAAEGMKDLNPSAPEALNPADLTGEAVKHSSSTWNSKMGYKREEFTQFPEYRGEGLAPDVITHGHRVERT